MKTTDSGARVHKRAGEWLLLSQSVIRRGILRIDVQVRQKRILNVRSTHRWSSTEINSSVITDPAALLVTLPDTGRTPGRKSSARLNENRILLAKYGKGRIYFHKDLSQLRPEQAT